MSGFLDLALAGITTDVSIEENGEVIVFTFRKKDYAYRYYFQRREIAIYNEKTVNVSLLIEQRICGAALESFRVAGYA